MTRRSRYFDRREPFRLNPYSSLAAGAVFLGLGGQHCPGSLRFFDTSPFGNHGTLTNMDPPTDWVWVPELGRWALDFDGSNDYVALPDAFRSMSRYSIFLWIKGVISGAQNKNAFGTAASKGFRLSENFSASSMKWFITGQYGEASATWIDVSDGKWHHLGVVLLPTGFQTYRDGVAIGSPVNYYPPAVITDYPAIGRPGSDDTHYRSQFVADPIVWNRVLSAPEIAALADPSNTTLSGLLLPARTRVFQAAAAGTLLTIQDASHAHSADEPSLTQHNLLVAQDASHAHSADEPSLTQHSALVVQDAAHAHAAASLTLGVGLVTADASHAHAAESLVLTQHNTIVVAESEHAHTADNLTLTYHEPGVVTLVIQDALHDHAADSLDLVQHGAVTIEEAAHNHSAQNLVLGVALLIAEAEHDHAADGLQLTQHHSLSIEAASHDHLAAILDLIQHNAIGVAAALHAHSADSLNIVYHAPGGPAKAWIGRINQVLGA